MKSLDYEKLFSPDQYHIDRRYFGLGVCIFMFMVGIAIGLIWFSVDELNLVSGIVSVFVFIFVEVYLVLGLDVIQGLRGEPFLKGEVRLLIDRYEIKDWSEHQLSGVIHVRGHRGIVAIPAGVHDFNVFWYAFEPSESREDDYMTFRHEAKGPIMDIWRNKKAADAEKVVARLNGEQGGEHESDELVV